ncbi:universal stress protein [Blastopirellula retiformator]|uniref:Universal stress protein family protein n=1 Tax=Blastopirellula retiformator TaxID=2527970 RepID=A0A5C5V027_9BACT|nr:universal stress protein [Blastopirellula retiformator]TWT31974.1 Universal stress protein family protein [Blastopirellula retiformator]
MIRSVLLALDASEASQTAKRMAIRFCRDHNQREDMPSVAIHLTGVAVVDTPNICAPMAVPLGAGAYKKDRDETLLAKANEEAEAILSQFEADCVEAGVPHTAVRSEGLPYEQIEAVSRTHDVIMIGHDTNFHYETHKTISETVRRLLLDNARPVIVFPKEAPTNDSVVISYDGSIPASHALHMWTLLRLRRPETKVHVVSVDRDLAVAQRHCDEAAELLRYHQVQATLHPTKLTSSVVNQLSEVIDEIAPRTVIMGAYGSGGFREALFGSSTNKMLENAKTLLFLYK